MRPSLLTISAWGPYPETVTVDFSKFQEGSVFLVTGPTGAGKTTIFDAISYALYGNVSGANRDKSTVRSDFAAPDADTYVDFTFTHKGTSYHIYRTPKYERPKKRGEGFTTSAETAVLEIGNEAPIASVQEVNRKVEEIMGINYEQFKQIAMIAQGEFLSLLYAKSEDKVEIFRNLFQTQMYDRILKNLTERSRNLYVQMKEHANKMDEAIASIDCSADGELTDLVQAEHKNYEKIIELLKADIHESESKAKELKKEASLTEEAYKKQLNKIAFATELNRDLDLLEQTKKAMAALLQQEDSITQVQEQLNRARQAQAVEVHDRMYQEACRRSEQWKLEVDKAKNALAVLESEFVQLQQDLLKVKELEQQMEEQKQKIHWLESLLPLLLSLDEQEARKTVLQTKLDQAVRQEAHYKAVQEQQKETKQKLTEQRKQYDTVESRLGEIKLQIAEAKQRFESMQLALKQLEVIYKEEAALKTIQEEYIAQETKLGQVKERYEAKERMYRQAAVGLAAKYLEEGQPCPVCGSIQHPHKAVVSSEVPDEAEVEKEKKLFEQAQGSYNEVFNRAAAMSGALESKKEELNRMMQQLGVTEQSGLVEGFNQIKQQSKQLIAERTQYEQLQKMKLQCDQMLADCEANLEKSQQMLEAVRNENTVLQREYDTITGSIANIHLQLPREYTKSEQVEREISVRKEKLHKAEVFVEQIQTRKEQLVARRESTEALLKSHQSQLELSGEEEKKQQEVWLKALTDQGFQDREEYESSRLTKEDMQARESMIQTYQEQLTSYQEQEKHLIQRTAQKERIDVNQLNETLNQIVELRKQQQHQSEVWTAKILCNRKAWESLKEKHAKIADLSETYGYVKDLENAAKGQNGERIVFEHYVLASYFEDILMAANLRLSVMTNSRYELMKVSKVSDQRTKNSLDIEVLDQYTGKRRPVKTLSGGESFKAALSLALGLSDIIQQNAGGIEVDTLFIDEGFGSLDSESLDQALKTLTTLTGKNKLVGIISHVSELKERIDNQIVIEKDHGGSKLKVIC